MIAAPYKVHLYHSISKYVPSTIPLDIVPTEIGWFRRIPAPTGRTVSQLVRFRPDIVLTDYATFPSWYSKLYSLLRREHVCLIAWLLGDIWREYFAYFSTVGFPRKLLGPPYLFAWSKGLEFADRILVVCRWLEAIVKERLPEKRTSLLYQGIDPDRWLTPVDVAYPFKHPAVGILQDNNILPKVKGLIWFSNVVKDMKDVNFYIAGSGPYTPLVEEAYSDLPNVRLLGRLPYPHEVRRFYQSLDVYVLASGLDCCPTTLLEASICGLPVIASRVGGIPELVVEGKTGWTARNDDTDAWVARIRQVVGDPELASRLGREGQRLIIEKFNWKRQVSRLVSIFKDELDA